MEPSVFPGFPVKYDEGESFEHYESSHSDSSIEKVLERYDLSNKLSANRRVAHRL